MELGSLPVPSSEILCFECGMVKIAHAKYSLSPNVATKALNQLEVNWKEWMKQFNQLAELDDLNDAS